jgi:hypothetical protein
MSLSKISGALLALPFKVIANDEELVYIRYAKHYAKQNCQNYPYKLSSLFIKREIMIGASWRCNSPYGKASLLI